MFAIVRLPLIVWRCSMKNVIYERRLFVRSNPSIISTHMALGRVTVKARFGKSKFAGRR